MQPTDEMPQQTWRWLGWAAVTLLFVIVAGIFMISAGVADPKPIGKLIYRDSLLTQPVAAGSESLNWLDVTEVRPNATVRLTAAYESGQIDAGYGLVIGDESDYLVVALSPLGYVAIWRGFTDTKDPAGCDCQQETSHEVIPWQPWPHILINGETNEIWIDVESGGISTVRVNREILWQQPIELNDRHLGLWFKSNGSWTSIAFKQLEMFQE